MKTTIKTMTSMGAAFLLASVANVAQAVPTISVDPASQIVGLGANFTVDLVWDGDGPNYLGDWDIDLLYDDSILQYDGATFHFGVDSLGCLPGVSCDDFSVPGLIDLFEVSFDAIPDLIANQDGLGNTFAIATLDFTALVDGLTDLTFGFGTFGDEGGIPITPALVNGEVCVSRTGAPCEEVPLPGVVPLMALGFAGLVWGRRVHSAA